jgi:polyhydroxyalkanoate synthesis regulator phasin
MNGHQLAEALANAKSISEVARLVKEEVIPTLNFQQSDLDALREQVKHLETQVYGGITK